MHKKINKKDNYKWHVHSRIVQNLENDLEIMWNKLKYIPSIFSLNQLIYLTINSFNTLRKQRDYKKQRS